MTLAISNAFINWHTFIWTPVTGSPVTISRVNSVKPTRGGTAEKYKGDAAVFFQLVAVPTQERSIDVETAAINLAASIPIGVPGSIIVTLDDFVNKATATGGAITVGLTLCQCVNNPFQGDHAKTASGTLTFEGYALDGVTDPLVVTAL